ncbi:MAG: DUF349 domain-containing protein [Bacteroidales bacterium]|nr:DUF349 domain-containing protein [Bacteroidales bacterium]
MKNSKKAPQNPEPETTSIQEEITATIHVTEDSKEEMLPTDADQTEKIDHADAVDKVLVEDAVEPPVVEDAVEPPVVEDAVEPPVVEETVESPVIEQPVESPEAPLEDAPSKHHKEHAEVLMAVLGEEDNDDDNDEQPDEVTEVHIDDEDQETHVSFESMSRAELVESLEKSLAEDDFNTVKTKIALIKFSFLKKKKDESMQKTDETPEDDDIKQEHAPEQDELDLKFNELFIIYRASKARHSEEQEKIKQENLKKKFEILDGLRELISSEETLKRTYDEFKALQERWKEIGMVPRTEINNLWQNYHFLVEKFFEKVKLNKELKDLDLKKNLEAKMALCEKTEELLLETSVLKSFKKLQKYHEEWKDLGPVPSDKKEEIWERFKNTTDKINDRRREHYSLIEEDQNKNLETKTALCEQCEIVAGLPNESIRDWQDNTNKINDLLKIWKNIGPVPQKVNAEIWKRFKTSLDSFFAVKKEYFDKLKEQQMHNYNLKVELCMQAEALNSSTDWRNTTHELIRLQGEWKKIGPVPRKHSDRIWKRFRSACDVFFNAKQAYFSNIHASEGENLDKKNNLMIRLKEHKFGDDKSANLEALKNFQREWTEIGHVPMKEKDRLHNEFRALINEHLDKLQISEVEMSAVSFQAKIEHMKNDPNARRVIGKEREFLSTKITKMKEEITLWENNIGFFAKSKSALIVKEEFESKINKAKSELKVLEAKMKILKQQGD